MVRVATVFLPAAAVGTIGHELGHFAVAKALGCAPTLHYASVTAGCLAGQSDPTLRVLGIAAGPVSSMVTGSLGIALLARWRKHHTRLDIPGTIYTVVALFWSRPLFNLLIQVEALTLGGRSWSAVANSDEARISTYLGAPLLTVGVVSAVLSAGVCIWTTAQVPPRDRTGWMTGAVVGSLIGFAVWMAVLGPAWLP